MNPADFTAQLKGDGFQHIETKRYELAPANGEHEHHFGVRERYSRVRSPCLSMASPRRIGSAKFLMSNQASNILKKSGRKAQQSSSGVNSNALSGRQIATGLGGRDRC